MHQILYWEINCLSVPDSGIKTCTTDRKESITNSWELQWNKIYLYIFNYRNSIITFITLAVCIELAQLTVQSISPSCGKQFRLQQTARIIYDIVPNLPEGALS